MWRLDNNAILQYLRDHLKTVVDSVLPRYTPFNNVNDERKAQI